MNRKNIGFVEGPILSPLLVFCLPIFVGMVFQTLYNLVDSIIVGQFVSVDALAAVGTTAPAANLMVGMMMGFATGASVTAAQYIGAKQEEKIKPTLSTTMIFMVTMSIVMICIALPLAGTIMHWLNVPMNIYADTVTYFRIYVCGLVFMALYNFFASFLRAMGDSTTPLIFLIISSLLNVFGDLFFLLTMQMGVAGAALATVLAQMISVALCIVHIRRKIPYFQFAKDEFVFERSLFRNIVRLGLPSGLQASIAGVGMLAVQSLINSFGSVSIAAYTAASKMEQISNIIMMSVSQGFAIFVGQNIGAGKINRVNQGLKEVILFAGGVSLAMSLIVYVSGPDLMSLFVSSADQQVIDVGAAFMRRWAPFVVLHALQSVVVSVLRGAGDSIFSMISAFTDLFTRTIMAYVFVRLFGSGFMGIAYSLPCGWLAACTVSVLRYLSGAWKKKAVV